MIQKCGAKARTSGGAGCKRAASANGRCHLHGGKSTGAKTLKGKHSQKMASWKHGLYSKEAKAERRAFRQMVDKYKDNLKGNL